MDLGVTEATGADMQLLENINYMSGLWRDFIESTKAAGLDFLFSFGSMF